MKEKLCSIIVPIYNVENYLSRCIESIINQDYENIEIILVNDGSTDNSKAICKQYLEKDKRIKLINKNNGGLSSARNVALGVAKGDFILFVDSDDYVFPNFCSNIVRVFSEAGVDIVIFGFNAILVEKRKVVKHYSKHSRKLSNTEAFNGLLIDGYINNLAWNKAYKRELFDGISYPEGYVFEDVATTYKLFDKANGIYISSTITYNYEIRDNSISAKWWCNDNKMNDFFLARLSQLKYFEEKMPCLIKKAYASTAFVALMADIYLKEKNSEISLFLKERRYEITHSSFPYNILFNIYYLFPRLSKKIINIIYG